jgi:hypothetical protein
MMWTSSAALFYAAVCNRFASSTFCPRLSVWNELVFGRTKFLSVPQLFISLALQASLRLHFQFFELLDSTF